MRTFIVLAVILLAAGLDPLNADTLGGIPVGVNQQAIEGELFDPRIFKQGPDGDIYVFDKKDQLLKVYSSQTGNFLRLMARKGQGPGEFLSFGSFGFTKDNLLFFTEYTRGRRWITLMELSGKFHHLIKLKRYDRFGLVDTIILPNQQILAQLEVMGESRKSSGYFHNYINRCLCIISAEGEIVKTIIKNESVYSFSTAPHRRIIRTPDFPGFLWGLTADNRIIFSLGNSNVLEIYNLDGKRLGTIKTPLPKASGFSEEDLEKWRKNYRKEIVEIDGQEFYNKYISIIGKYKPLYGKKRIISRISVTPGGNILVGEPEMAGTYKYHLVNMKGKAQVQVVSKAKSLEMGRDYLLYLEEDEDENTVLRCVKKNGSEADALLSIGK